MRNQNAHKNTKTKYVSCTFMSILNLFNDNFTKQIFSVKYYFRAWHQIKQNKKWSKEMRIFVAVVVIVTLTEKNYKYYKEVFGYMVTTLLFRFLSVLVRN